MNSIHNFDDLIKHFGNFDNFIEKWYDAYIDEQFTTICGDEITSDDLSAIFKDNNVLITNAKKFLKSNPQYIKQIIDEFVIPAWQYEPIDMLIDTYNLNLADDFDEMAYYDSLIKIFSSPYIKQKVINNLISNATLYESQGEQIFAKIEKTDDLDTIINHIYSWIIKIEPELIPHIKWIKVHDSIGYEFSAFDDNKQFAMNPYMQDLYKQLKNHISSFYEVYPNYKNDESCQKIINDLWAYFNQNQLATIYSMIRQYAIDYNSSGPHKNISKNLVDIQDDDKIGVKDSYNLDFNPADADYLRDQPIVMKRKYDSNNNYKDYILIGKNGMSHWDVIKDNKEIFNDEDNIDSNYRDKITFAYMLGNVAFINMATIGNFGTLNEIVSALKSQPGIQKVYTCPKDRSGPITRLAQRV